MQHCRPRMPLELWVLTVLLIFIFIFFYFNDIFYVRNTYKNFFKKKYMVWDT